MTKKRIVITGMGCVSCFGDDTDNYFQKLLQGTSGVKPISHFDVSSTATKIAACVEGMDPEPYIAKKMLRRIDPVCTYAFVAAKKALAQAGLQAEKCRASRTGILIGSGMGGMKTFAEGVENLKDMGYRRISPFFVPYILSNMIGGLLAIDLGFEGPNYSISTACATATNCLYAAYHHLQRGEADVMLCGGSEAAVVPIGLGGFMAVKALSTRNEEANRASRPWDKQRDGFVMGEGSGVLVLETLEHANKRGAPILAELMGGAINCDAHHMTEPKAGGDGVAACLQMALQQAGLQASDIDYLNAHATSTPAGDLVEIQAYEKVFGDALPQIPINATKSMVGHSLGAAGALEAIATIMCLQHQVVHPNLNLDEPEEKVQNLDLLFHEKKSRQMTYGLSSSFGFGGHNACIIFKKANA